MSVRSTMSPCHIDLTLLLAVKIIDKRSNTKLPLHHSTVKSSRTRTIEYEYRWHCRHRLLTHNVLCVADSESKKANTYSTARTFIAKAAPLWENEEPRVESPYELARSNHGSDDEYVFHSRILTYLMYVRTAGD
eukprot:m.810875 g.810875  ORF g.810875 m.810875 type:complete len:134 (-) comp23389_c0_seq21:2015-2416(-)